MPNITEITTIINKSNLLIVDIKSRIEEFKFLINEKFKEQSNYDQKFEKMLNEETSENNEYEKDLVNKKDVLKKLRKFYRKIK